MNVWGGGGVGVDGMVDCCPWVTACQRIPVVLLRSLVLLDLWDGMVDRS